MFGQIEKNYDFRKEMLILNKKGICCEEILPKENEISLLNGVFFTGVNSSEIEVAKKDFLDFLKVSANSKTPENKNGLEIELIIGGELYDVNSYKGRVITVSKEKIVINAFDFRGAAAALFDLEELMLNRKAPIIAFGVYKNRPLFSPRMAHSGYGLDEFPENYMIRLLKEGIDAIILFMEKIGTNAFGEPMDVNALIEKANSMGLDVYAYCKLQNFHHPDEENAEETFDKVYGDFFRAHKGFKGLILVGESVEFPSRDTRVAPRYYYEIGEDGIPDGKLSPGWFPCYDFPDWLNLVKKSVHSVKPDADIVFWTYNWGWAPEKERIELLNNLPTDISLMVTFEMFQKFPFGDVDEMVCDYSLTRAEAGDYFISEAKVAKERNIRLYSQANTGGRTWDFGILQYEPMPYRWKRRYDAINDSREKYNLCGIMECHHYGFTPSYITRFEKYCFELAGDFKGENSDDYLENVLTRYFGNDIERLKKAFRLISDALDYYPPTDEMQYGPFRVGTAYPLNLVKNCVQKKKPYEYNGMDICVTEFRGMDSIRTKFTPHGVRIHTEIERLSTAKDMIDEGIAILEEIKNPNDNLLKEINLLKYMSCMFLTAINVQKFYIEKCKLQIAPSKTEASKILDNIVAIAENEIQNAENSIEYAEKDSGIGFECSMCYRADKELILWKIKQVKYMLDNEVLMYRNCLED